jgi:hypothetical protein
MPVSANKAVCVSVLRDTGMYHRCVEGNPHANQCVLHAIDNRRENAPVSVQYNRFLDAYDYSVPAWFVFCHEDFELLEPLDPYLAKADTASIYGPIGASTKIRLGVLHVWELVGSIVESAKDGSSVSRVGTPAAMGTPVETFDCLCLIVHSDLVLANRLRFDPRLSFDLYVEDFCIQAREQHQIPSRILPVACRHWSHGSVSERYREHEQYLKTKYPRCCYTGTSSYDIGTPGLVRRWNNRLKKLLKRWLSELGKRKGR